MPIYRSIPAPLGAKSNDDAGFGHGAREFRLNAISLTNEAPYEAAPQATNSVDQQMRQ